MDFRAWSENSCKPQNRVTVIGAQFENTAGTALRHHLVEEHAFVVTEVDHARCTAGISVDRTGNRNRVPPNSIVEYELQQVVCRCGSHLL